MEKWVFNLAKLTARNEGTNLWTHVTSLRLWTNTNREKITKVCDIFSEVLFYWTRSIGLSKLWGLLRRLVNSRTV